MMESYIQSKVITVPKENVQSGNRVYLSSYGLSPSLIHLHGCNFFVSTSSASNNIIASLKLFNGSETIPKLAFDISSGFAFISVAEPNGSCFFMFDEFHIKFTDGISLEVTWGLSSDSLTDLTGTVFYQ